MALNTLQIGVRNEAQVYIQPLPKHEKLPSTNLSREKTGTVTHR